MKAEVTGLDQFDLNRSALVRLRGREVSVKVHLQAFEITPAVVRRSPDERHDFLRGQAHRWLANLRSRFPASRWVVASHARDIPMELSGRIAADHIPDLSSQPGVRLIYVSHVPGHRRRPRRREPLQWFCVRGRVAIQIEDETEGMQTVEDRFVLVRAASSHDAEQRLRRHWREYAEPYLNPHGHLVRWKLEAITDIYDIAEDHLDSAGVEVYSKLSRRRMKAQFVWRHLRKGV